MFHFLDFCGMLLEIFLWIDKIDLQQSNLLMKLQKDFQQNNGMNLIIFSKKKKIN